MNEQDLWEFFGLVSSWVTRYDERPEELARELFACASEFGKDEVFSLFLDALESEKSRW